MHVTALLQKSVGVAGGVVWLHSSSESLLDRGLFELHSTQRHQFAHHLWSDPAGALDTALVLDRRSLA